MTNSEKLIYLIKYLLSERPDLGATDIPCGKEERFRLFRGLVNIRPPKPVSPEFLRVQDEFLQEELLSRGITDVRDMTRAERGIYLWKGDITTLRCGAIVNAANSAMLGCFQPCHGCIDNAIHTFAGVQLRLECAEIMRRQGHEEPTGSAKITSAYNLPCGNIIHTVGPIVNGGLSEAHRIQLESCYSACLETAWENGIRSAAFCCISTGVFGFPQKAAAETAVSAVRNFIKAHDIEVIFNVFKQDDFDIYKRLLG